MEFCLPNSFFSFFILVRSICKYNTKAAYGIVQVSQ
jgi:hypothetical protein